MTMILLLLLNIIDLNLPIYDRYKFVVFMIISIKLTQTNFGINIFMFPPVPFENLSTLQLRYYELPINFNKN